MGRSIALKAPRGRAWTSALRENQKRVRLRRPMSRGRERGPLKTAADATEKEVQDTYGSKRGIGGTMLKRLRVALISGGHR
jgi:hypothetical protein